MSMAVILEYSNTR